MTKRKENPSKGGRKPKAPGEKLRQLSIRVSPTTRLGLELVARDLNISVSEVAERFVTQKLQSQTVAGTTVYDLITEMGKADFALADTSPGHRERVAESIVSGPQFLVMSLPPVLRRPHEALFANVYERLGLKTEGNLELIWEPEATRQLLEACAVAQRQGVSEDQLVEEWGPLLKAQTKT